MRRYAMLEAPSVLGLWPSGVERLPEAILEGGLGERIGARSVGRVEPPKFDPTPDPRTGVLNARAIADYSRCLADGVGGLLDDGWFPIVLGGDCSIVLGSLLALRRRLRPGLLFLDGQADFYQVEAEPKGEAASMDLALATGRGPRTVANIEGRGPLVRDEDVVVLGYRDAADAAEHGSQPLASGIRAIPLDELRRVGAASAVKLALAHLERPDGPERFWIHLDVDVLDDAIMPAVDYRMPDGLGWDELATVLRTAVASPNAAGLEVCIFNPSLDPSFAARDGLVDVLARALAPSTPS